VRRDLVFLHFVSPVIDRVGPCRENCGCRHDRAYDQREPIQGVEVKVLGSPERHQPDYEAPKVLIQVDLKLVCRRHVAPPVVLDRLEIPLPEANHHRIAVG
jgi:hypothetical protein